MLIYGRVVNMTSMSIIFYFEQVNECWQLPTLVAKGFRHLNSPKSTLKNFYNALLGSMSRNGVFLIARIWKYRFSEGILVKKFIFLKSLPSCSGRSWGYFNRFFSVFWDSWEHISGRHWSCMWWRYRCIWTSSRRILHASFEDVSFPRYFALLFKGKSKLLLMEVYLKVL